MPSGELFRINLSDLFPATSFELSEKRKSSGYIVYTELESVIEHIHPSKMNFNIDPGEKTTGPVSSNPFIKEWQRLDLSQNNSFVAGSFYDDPEEIGLVNTIVSLLKKSGDLQKVWVNNSYSEVYLEEFVRDHSTCIKLLRDRMNQSQRGGRYRFTHKLGRHDGYHTMSQLLDSWAKGMGVAISYEGVGKPIIIPSEGAIIRTIDPNSYSRRFELDLLIDAVSMKGTITKRNKRSDDASKKALERSQVDTQFQEVRKLEDHLMKVYKKLPDVILGEWKSLFIVAYAKDDRLQSSLQKILQAVPKDKSKISKKIRTNERLRKMVLKPYRDMILARREIAVKACKLTDNGYKWKKVKPTYWSRYIDYNSMSAFHDLAGAIGIPPIKLPDTEIHTWTRQEIVKYGMHKLLDETFDLELISTKEGYVWKYTKNQKAKQKKETTDQKVVKAVKSTLQRLASAA